MESDEQKSDFDKIGSDVQKSEIDEMESVEQKLEVDTMGSDSKRSELNAMRSDEQKSEFYGMRSDDPKSELGKKALVDQISDFDNKGSDELKPEFDTDEYKSKFEKPQQSSRLQQNILPWTPNAKDVQSDSHKISQSSKQHKLVGIESEQAESTKNNGTFARSCTPCKLVRKENIASDVCKECEVFLCKKCARTHKMPKATKMHHLINAENVPQEYCEPCMSKGKHVRASRLCNQCEELLCSSCSEMHASFKATKSHTLGDIPLKIPDLHSCCPCKGSDKEVNAVHYCAECEEYYCTTCGDLHGRQKATLSHNLVKVAEMGKAKNERDYIRDDKGSNEKISEFDEMGFDVPKLKSQFERPQQTSHLQQDMDKEKKPGTPTPSDVQSDSIELTWEPPKCLSQDEPVREYEIRYKEGPNSVWRRYSEFPDRACARINGLKSECSYKFIVRAVYEYSEGPYSPESIEITTKASLASTLPKFTVKMKKGGKGTLRLKSTEIFNARNCEAKTRKFEVDLGKPTVKEKTILLVGETGSGKSTLVDGFINYFAGVNFEDPFRLTLVDLERDKMGKSQATSQTEWVTCYTIHPGPSSRIHYTLNIIDTPGFGDTRGLDKDKKLFDQLRQLFSSDGEKGVVFIDAVCLLMKAPDARLTTSSKYIYTSVLSLFGKDIKNNICALITFADGKKPKVLSAMEEAKLPIKSWYVFNNSGLFEDNKEDSFASMFWKIGQKSFQDFFKGLENMKTKSLKQTTEVLENRKQMEITISNLEPLIDAGLRKKEELRIEMQIIKKHETDIATNQNYEYTVDETHLEKSDLPNGKFATNCLQCKVTCHRDCWSRPDALNYFCSAMNLLGNCKQCDGKCPSSQHKNEPSSYQYKTKKVKKTYAKLLKKYEAARNKKLTHEQHIEEMEKDMSELDNKVFHLMEEVRKCNQVLTEIALQPNVISMKEYIDQRIQTELMYKSDGFQERITALRYHRKKVEIKDSSLNEGVVATHPVENQKTNKLKEKTGINWFINLFR